MDMPICVVNVFIAIGGNSWTPSGLQPKHLKNQLQLKKRIHMSSTGFALHQIFGLGLSAIPTFDGSVSDVVPWTRIRENLETSEDIRWDTATCRDVENHDICSPRLTNPFLDLKDKETAYILSS